MTWRQDRSSFLLGAFPTVTPPTQMRLSPCSSVFTTTPVFFRFSTGMKTASFKRTCFTFENYPSLSYNFGQWKTHFKITYILFHHTVLNNIKSQRFSKFSRIKRSTTLLVSINWGKTAGLNNCSRSPPFVLPHYAMASRTSHDLFTTKNGIFLQKTLASAFPNAIDIFCLQFFLKQHDFYFENKQKWGDDTSW